MDLTIKNFMVMRPTTVPADMPVSEALEIMRESGFRHLPVTKDNLPFSIVSEREIALVMATSENIKKTSERPISDFCALDLVCVPASASILSVLKEFINKKIGAIVVIEEGEFVGIFTVIDVCKIFHDVIATKS